MEISAKRVNLLSRLSELPEMLRRPTSKGKFLPEIDGLRFVAILSVLLVHVGAWTLSSMKPLDAQGGADAWWAAVYFHLERGVDLFFIISGFIIALPFVHAYRKGLPKPAFAPYVKRRLYRLEPPFLIAMTLTFAGLILVHGARFGELWEHFLATITYLHGVIYGEKSTINFVTWSLEIEVQFYLVAPLLFATMKPTNVVLRRATYVAVGILSLLLFEHLKSEFQVIHALLPAHLATFMAGVFLADIYADGHLARAPKSRFWDIIAVGALLIGFSVPRESGVGKLAMALSFAVFVAAGFKSEWLSRFLRNRWVSAIGGMCYSIYLIHMPLIYGLGKLTRALLFHGPFWMNFLAQALLLVPALILLSAFYFITVERPFMTARS